MEIGVDRFTGNKLLCIVDDLINLCCLNVEASDLLVAFAYSEIALSCCESIEIIGKGFAFNVGYLEGKLML